mmetsp:Transcript_1749/g.4065  ORF Transcript_1749/g.4065 Transcript_1749/m.4065 type:complete len:223 (-) Transcript_1749:975-1643(-)
MTRMTARIARRSGRGLTPAQGRSPSAAAKAESAIARPNAAAVALAAAEIAAALANAAAADETDAAAAPDAPGAAAADGEAEAAEIDATGEVLRDGKRRIVRPKPSPPMQKSGPKVLPGMPQLRKRRRQTLIRPIRRRKRLRRRLKSRHQRRVKRPRLERRIREQRTRKPRSLAWRPRRARRRRLQRNSLAPLRIHSTSVLRAWRRSLAQKRMPMQTRRFPRP